MANTFYSTMMALLRGAEPGVYFFTGTAASSGSFWKYSMVSTSPSQVFILEDDELNSGAKPATVANFIASWTPPGASGVAIGYPMTTDITSSNCNYVADFFENCVGCFYTLCKKCTDYASLTTATQALDETSVFSAVYEPWFGYLTDTSGDSYAFMFIESASYSTKSNISALTFGALPPIVPCVDIIQSSRRSIAATVQVDMGGASVLPGMLDLGGLLFFRGNPSSVNVPAVSGANYSCAPDVETDLQDQSGLFTLLGRVLTFPGMV
jgi:hypothetical protein